MVTVKRETIQKLVIDNIYINNKLSYRQPNLAIRNKFGSKKVKLNTGKVLEVANWERV
jgi:hypothetical protein